MTTSLIINADDFGRCPKVNAAVIQAWREGVLTSASLMVTGEAAQEAVALARQALGLAVGLHLVLASGKSVLGKATLPHLVDAAGNFPASGFRAGMALVFSRAARRELDLELQAQFEAFHQTGLVLDHVDSHLHFHLHPVVFGRVLRLAQAYGANGIRIPADDLRLALAYNRSAWPVKVLWFTGYGMLGSLAGRKLRGSSIPAAGRVYGLFQSGRMETRYVLRLLTSLPDGLVEIYFHPATWEIDALGPNPVDLNTLLEPQVRSALETGGWQVVSYTQFKVSHV
jgi:chitin disaccharide deacetylase